MTDEHWSIYDFRRHIRELEAERDQLRTALESAMRVLIEIGAAADDELHDVRCVLGRTGELSEDEK